MNKFYSTIEEIQKWLDYYSTLSINAHVSFIKDKEYGFVVDVKGSVSINNEGLDFIPVKFNVIDGGFSCTDNKLTSLDFAPIEVKDEFGIANNLLTSLSGSPKKVGMFDCSNNLLPSLEGGPIEVEALYKCVSNSLLSLKGSPEVISGNFLCSNNQLTSLEGCPKKIARIFDVANNKISTLEFIPDFIGTKIYLDSNPSIPIMNEDIIYGSTYCMYYDKLSELSKIFKEQKLLNELVPQRSAQKSTNKV